MSNSRETRAGSGLELNRLQSTWKTQARDFALEILEPHAKEIDEQGIFPRDNLRQLGERGFLGLPVPESLGGTGADVLTIALVTLELAKGCPSTAMCYHMHTGAVYLLVALAEGSQEDRWVKPVREGKWLGAVAATEPGSGSRIWHTDSVAERIGDEYALDCIKSFVTNAGHADFYIVPVRARPGASFDEVTLFVQEAEKHPQKALSEWNALGFRGSTSAPMRFARRFRTDEILGPVGGGFPVLIAFNMPVYLVGLAAIYVGIAEAALEATIKHVGERMHTDTGNLLSSVETVQHHVGSMRMKVARARALLHRVARLADHAVKVLLEVSRAGALADVIDTVLRDDQLFMELAEAKAVASETAAEVTRAAFVSCGGAAFKKGHPIERLLRDAQAGAIMAPSDDAVRVLLGRRLLGYPFPWEVGNSSRPAD